MAGYGKFMDEVKPAIEAAGGGHLVRCGEHEVLKGHWRPSRLVLFEFPSMQAAEDFHNGEAYQGMRPIRLASSTARALVLVEGAQAAATRLPSSAAGASRRLDETGHPP